MNTSIQVTKENGNVVVNCGGDVPFNANNRLVFTRNDALTLATGLIRAIEPNDGEDQFYMVIDTKTNGIDCYCGEELFSQRSEFPDFHFFPITKEQYVSLLGTFNHNLK